MASRDQTIYGVAIYPDEQIRYLTEPVTHDQAFEIVGDPDRSPRHTPLRTLGVASLPRLGPRTSMYLDDDGRRAGLTANRIAALFYFQDPDQVDAVIAGTVVITNDGQPLDTTIIDLFDDLGPGGP